MNRSTISAVIVAAAFLTIISTKNEAQAQLPTQVTNTYAAKFICGVQKDGGINDMPDAQPGRYSSKINVHNNTGVLVKFRKKIILLKGGQVAIDPQAKLMHDGLKSDQAMEVVCKNIYEHLHIQFNPPPYIEGFVIFEVLQPFHTTAAPPDPLDVEGIYTYKGDMPGTTGSGVSIAVVVFPAKSNKHPLP